MSDSYDHLKAQKDRIERQHAVAAQRAECARVQAFLKQKGMATNNLRHATTYAEASAMIDEYVAALEAVDPYVLSEVAALRAEVETLKVEWEELEVSVKNHDRLYLMARERAEAAESALAALRDQLTQRHAERTT